MPLNGWPPGEKLQQLGEMMYENITGAIEPISLPIFIGPLGWSEEAARSFFVQVCKDIADTNMHAFMPL